MKRGIILCAGIGLILATGLSQATSPACRPSDRACHRAAEAELNAALDRNEEFERLAARRSYCNRQAHAWARFETTRTAYALRYEAQLDRCLREPGQ